VCLGGGVVVICTHVLVTEACIQRTSYGRLKQTNRVAEDLNPVCYEKLGLELYERIRRLNYGFGCTCTLMDQKLCGPANFAGSEC